MIDKEKGPLVKTKRPKSREETPKEGSGSAMATAPQQYATATHKTQGISNYFPCKMYIPGSEASTLSDVLLNYFNYLVISRHLTRFCYDD
jgi:hypothetical protein